MLYCLSVVKYVYTSLNLTLTLSLVSIVINKLTVWVMLTICSNQSSLE